MLLNNGGTSELVCISAVSGASVTLGNNSQCDNGAGCASATAGRGCHSTTPATFATSGTTIYYNTFNAGGVQGTSVSGVYPFNTAFAGMNTLGAGWDCVARDIPGKPKQLTCGGGGHSDYYGNELYSIFPNRVTPSVTLSSQPSTFAIPGFDSVGSFNFNGTKSADAQLKDGAWNTAHIEANFAYAPWTDQFCKFGGGYAGGNGLHSYDTMCFDFPTSTWQRFAGAGGGTDTDCTNHGTGFTSCSATNGHQLDPIGNFNAGVSGFSGLATADPLTQSIWEYWSRAGGNGVLTQYYPSVHQHVQRADTLFTLVCCGNSTQGMNRVLISDLRWVFLNGYDSTLSTYKIDISGVTSQTPTSSPNPTMAAVTTDASCASPLTSPSPGLIYIPQIARIVTYQANAGGNTYYLMDPTNWTCTSASPSGGPPSSPANPYIAGAMQYISSLDAILLVNDVGVNTPRMLSLAAGDPTSAFILPSSGGGSISKNSVMGGNSVRQ